MVGFSISFETDVSSLAAELPRWANDRIPSITRNALNDVVKLAWAGERTRIRGVFDRPTPLIQRSPLYTPATKQTLTAEVYIRDEGSRGGRAPSRIITPQVRGGTRQAKGFELLFRRRGMLLANEFVVPARDTPLDQYGNVRRSLITRILGSLGTWRRGGVRYFVPKRGAAGGLHPGVWEQFQGRRVRPVLLFVADTPDYRRRYPFGEATIDIARREFGPAWQRHWAAELAKHQLR